MPDHEPGGGCGAEAGDSVEYGGSPGACLCCRECRGCLRLRAARPGDLRFRISSSATGISLLGPVNEGLLVGEGREALGQGHQLEHGVFTAVAHQGTRPGCGRCRPRRFCRLRERRISSPPCRMKLTEGSASFMRRLSGDALDGSAFLGHDDLGAAKSERPSRAGQRAQ